MNSIIGELFIIGTLILFNGLLALSELALVSARKTKLEQLAKEGDCKAQIALELAQAPDGFLSTIQIGITFIGILAGSYGGVTLAEALAQYIAPIPVLGKFDQTISIGVVVMFITFLSVVIGELIPKRLALSNPESLARHVAPMIHRLSRLAKPLVKLLTGATNLLLQIAGFQGSIESAVTEDEIKLMIDKGRQAGTFQEFEQDTIERVFRLADRRVSVLMTPRSEIVWLKVNESQDEMKRKIAQNKYSSYPVAGDSLEDVVGVISGKDLLSLVMEDKPFNLKKICRKPLFIAEATSAVKAMELLKKSKMHVAFVVDEYGSIQGIVTFGDILRSVFDDIEDATEVERKIVERDDGSLLLSGILPLDEFIDYMEFEHIDQEELEGMNTVGGFVMAKFGYVPAEGESIIWNGFKFEVVDMDGRRVDKVLVASLPVPEKTTEQKDSNETSE